MRVKISSKLKIYESSHGNQVDNQTWHINSAHIPLNCDNGGLLPDTYLYLVRKKAAN